LLNSQKNKHILISWDKCPEALRGKEVVVRWSTVISSWVPFEALKDVCHDLAPSSSTSLLTYFYPTQVAGCQRSGLELGRGVRDSDWGGVLREQASS